MGIDQVVQDALHLLLDVSSGKIAHLPQDLADLFHEKITPGHTAVPLTDAEKAQLADLEARKAREQAAADEAAAAAAGDGASGESVASSAG